MKVIAMLIIVLIVSGCSEINEQPNHPQKPVPGTFRGVDGDITSMSLFISDNGSPFKMVRFVCKAPLRLDEKVLYKVELINANEISITSLNDGRIIAILFREKEKP